MLDSPIVLVTLCYYGLSKNELPIFIKSEKVLKIFILSQTPANLVETTGIEPVTSSLQSWRSPN